jgi:hypothetical protein
MKSFIGLDLLRDERVWGGILIARKRKQNIEGYVI